ncbi:MAG: class I SAM-dependent methyltransferase [Vicinamibacterales bacterium]
MKVPFLSSLLACPSCSSELTVASGGFACPGCAASFPTVDGIPRFVSADNYARSFGFQWNRFAQAQLDDHWGIDASRDRFRKETRWSHDLRGQLILEAGCGAGRFTAHAASTGARVVSFDYSSAVEAAKRNHDQLENVEFLQADIHRLPLRHGLFDKIFCFGVLQHCPDPAVAFRSLVPFLKPGGEIVVDIYRLSWKCLFQGKYYVRPLTRRIPPERLFPLVRAYVKVAYPALALPHRVFGSRVARMIGQVVSVCDYRGYFAVSDDKQFELCLLDTFDMLSPAHDHPRNIRTVRQWLGGAGLEAIEVRPGFNGLEARGRKPVDKRDGMLTVA